MRSKTQYALLVLCVVAFCFLGQRLWAQGQESLLIGPGDMLHIQVFDTPEAGAARACDRCGHVAAVDGRRRRGKSPDAGTSCPLDRKGVAGWPVPIAAPGGGNR